MKLKINNRLALIKVKKCFIEREKEALIKTYRQTEDTMPKRGYAENFNFSTQISLGLPENMDWQTWLAEYPLQSLSCDMSLVDKLRLNELFYAKNSEISLVQKYMPREMIFALRLCTRIII